MHTRLGLGAIDLRGDQVSVELLTLGLEMVSIVHEEFRVVDARSVPVNEHRVRVAPHPVGQHVVVRLLPGAWDLDVYEYNPVHALEYPHYLVELLRVEGTV